MPKDPKGQLRQTTTAKLSRGLLFVFFPNLANTVAEVGKPKPYGSGLEDPPAAGDPEPALHNVVAVNHPIAPFPWGSDTLYGLLGYCVYKALKHENK